ncbi:MAG: hypothetical protein PWQ60_1986 [Thermoanaerobacteraceae bacterium]|jgi:flagellar biosynthesis/type III secretory pathway protein FliH|nr:hypothetical protein [Thermoanaerobacteraceae bacterium]
MPYTEQKIKYIVPTFKIWEHDPLFSEEIKDIEQEVNEMAKMIIDPEIYRRGFEEGLEKGIERGIEKGIEKGIERGIEKGIERGVGKGIAETIIRQLCKKLGGLPVEYKERIQGQDRPTLELIADHIFDIESLSDLERFLKQ